jgi:hypothetical protein
MDIDWELLVIKLRAGTIGFLFAAIIAAIAWTASQC